MSKHDKSNYARVAFPLGGIGTGGINIAGNGSFTDCSFYNIPDRHNPIRFSNFAIKAEQNGKVADARFLNGDFTQPDYDNYAGRTSAISCVKHFKDCVFTGEYPFADISFKDGAFPGEVILSAFNPFIPMNVKDSALPAAFFSVKIKNDSDMAFNYTVALSFTNVLHKPGRHEYNKLKSCSVVTMGNSADKADILNLGDISIATDCEDVAYQQYWFRTSEFQPSWMSFDRLRLFYEDFSSAGKIKNRVYENLSVHSDFPDSATITAGVTVEGNSEKEVRFVLSRFISYYKKLENDSDTEILKNHYTAAFNNSAEVADYCFENWERLYSETKIFKEALLGSTFPEEVRDAIQANIATLKTPTCLLSEDGHFWAWEGIQDNAGSCYGTCQHVWNYAYALPFLFPKLEKQLRTDEFKYSLSDSGKMNFRMKLPFESDDSLPCCADGQMGTVIKAYREWKISGDNDWLCENWKYIKKCIEFAWSPKNSFLWDPDKEGVISGRQHHTLDIELFGVHAWLTGFYHAALLAGAEMAEFVGENDTAVEYRAIYKRGHERLESETFNGEYYVQKAAFTNINTLEKYGEEIKNFYWNSEVGEICFQIGEGCEIDQVLADFHTHLIGLDEVFDHNHKVSALKALYKYNFISMRDIVNSCRVFACNDEKGLVICRWPENAEKPNVPILYSDECMTGFEYSTACTMLMCGMEKEALEIVRAVRERYDGQKRNPWAEIECGASYARAMSSYAFLLTYSGFKYDMTANMIGFVPIKNGKYFWSLAGAWGVADISVDCIEFKVLYGNIRLKRFVTPFAAVKAVAANGKDLDFSFKGDTVLLDIALEKNGVLIIEAE